MRVLVSTSSFGRSDATPIEMLKDAGCDVRLNPHGRRLQPQESIELLKDTVGLVAGTELLNADVLANAGSLKVISRCGAGMDNVDREAAERLGMKVFNTPDAPSQAVAELALGLILSVLRRTTEADRSIRRGEWSPLLGRLLSGKTLGIVGLGHVGKRLAELTAPFSMSVLACEPKPDEEFVQSHDVRVVTLDELLADADVISLHVPGSSSTRHLIGTAEFAAMKPEAVIVNTSRGGVVDEEALRKALAEHRVSGAALDVYEVEPYTGPLTGLDNVLLTAHMGSYAKEARIQMEIEAVQNLLKGLGESNVGRSA